MKILTLNCGSSSVKYSLWDALPETRAKLCDGIVERVTLEGGVIRHQLPKAQEIVQYQECPDHATALRLIIDALTSRDCKVINDLSEIDAVAHRVVHGGEKFRTSVLIDNGVLETIEEYSGLAPLHNPPNLLGIKTMTGLMPEIAHIAVFDTAFFTTMPPSSYIYAMPYDWYEKYHIRRYGFHGSSHLYVSRRAAAILRKKPSEVNLITIHIGNGVSITAVKRGTAYDHSLGFTPLEGAVMGTRGGDVDPGIILHVMQNDGLNPSEMLAILNKKSGLLGITGKYTDRRDILTLVEQGDTRAKLALDIECHRLKKYVGAYMAVLGDVDAIVFTAGVGENSPIHRSRICDGLDLFGISIDPQKNMKAVGSKKETDISAPRARVKVFVIPTNEELVFVEDALAILQGKYEDYTKFEYSFEHGPMISSLAACKVDTVANGSLDTNIRALLPRVFGYIIFLGHKIHQRTYEVLTGLYTHVKLTWSGFVSS